MLETGILPDFITVDGGEGGTGAAPLEFTNRIGTPLVEGLIFVHNSLIGFNLRNEIRLIASGKITTGFDIIKRLAMGADLCYSARGMMMALGCIQALKCNTNTCPVGVTTQDRELMVGLVPDDKCVRVYNFQKNIVKSACEMMGAMGLENTDDLKPWHLMRRTEAYEIRNYSEIYDFLRSKYGEWIVYKPELNKHNILLWFLPYFILIFGGIIIFILVKKRKNQRLN